MPKLKRNLQSRALGVTLTDSSPTPHPSPGPALGKVPLLARPAAASLASERGRRARQHHRFASAGKIDRSSALIQQIDPTQLLPEEHDLFDPWRNRATLGAGLLGSIGTK